MELPLTSSLGKSLLACTLAGVSLVVHAQSVFVGSATPVNLGPTGLPTYTVNGVLTADFPDGHITAMWDGPKGHYDYLWAENQSYSTAGPGSLEGSAYAYSVLGNLPVSGNFGDAPTASGDRSNPTYFDNSGSWLMTSFHVDPGTFTLDPNSPNIIAFYHAEDHYFTDAAGTRAGESYYHDPVAWLGVGLVTSSDDGATYSKQGAILYVGDLKPEYPNSNLSPTSPQAPNGGIGNHCAVLDNHTNPTNPRWIIFFPNILPTGLTAGHGESAAASTDPNASRASWMAYYNGSFSVQQQSNEGSDSPLPGLDGAAGSDYDHYAISNPSVHWNTFLNKWVLVAATWDRSKILISYSNGTDPTSGWSEPTLLFAAPSGTSVTYPTIIGMDHLSHLSDTESGANATVYWAQFSSAGVRSMQSATLTFNAAAASTGSTATRLSSSAANSNVGQAVTFSAMVVPGMNTAVPTGTITFMDGTSSLGTVPLDATATAQVATSILSAGTHSITATYSGDSTFSGSISAALTQIVSAPAFAISLSSTALTIPTGTAGLFSINVDPVGGFDAPITLSCKGLPANSACTFSTATVTPNGSNVGIGVSASIVTNVQVASSAVHPNPATLNRIERRLLSGGVALSCLFPFMFLRRQGIRERAMLMLVAFSLLFSMTMAGCGSSTLPQGSSAVTPSGTSQVMVIATSGTQSQTATLSVVVQ